MAKERDFEDRLPAHQFPIATNIRTWQHYPSPAVFAPGIIEIIWPTAILHNITSITIPTAQPATMGDVGEDQLDLNNPPFPLTAIDRQLLVTKDEDFHRITWADLKQIIGIANVEPT